MSLLGELWGCGTSSEKSEKVVQRSDSSGSAADGVVKKGMTFSEVVSSSSGERGSLKVV